MSDIKPSPVIQANCDLLIKREQVGNIKYGITLDKAGLSIKQLLQHQLEELLDGANYTQAMLQQLDNTTYADGLAAGLAERDHLMKRIQEEFKIDHKWMRRALTKYQADAVIRGITR